MKRYRSIFVPLLFLAPQWFFVAAAQEASAHGDIFLAAIGGQVAVGGANELETPDENFELTTKLFSGVMIAGFPPFDPGDHGRNEPGFVALPSGDPRIPAGSNALPASAAVSLAFTNFTVEGESDKLFYWDGTGPVTFQPATFAQPGVAISLIPNPLGSTNSDGSFHDHAAFALDLSGASRPADGIYLVSPSASVAGLADSHPFYMLWLVDALLTDNNSAEALEEAIESGDPRYLDKNFAFVDEAFRHVHSTLIVPEPGTAFMSMLGLTLVGFVLPRNFRKLGGCNDV